MEVDLLGMTMTTFDSGREGLIDLLQGIRKGDIQLPDFQRGWVWDDEHVRSLLASISLSYPIGAVMMLHTGNPDVKFKTRIVEGLQLSTLPEADRLILDGQQRLTSLFQALNTEKPVLTRDIRGREIQRWYYIDIEAALNPYSDREDAIISVPETRQVKNFRGEITEDYSTPDKEYENGLFPISQVFDCSSWREGHQEFWDYDRDKIKLFSQFEREIVKRFDKYQVPVISLGRETPKEAVCQVFEKVNTGGVSLTVFELLTATFAAEDYLLRQDWEQRQAQLNHFQMLHGIASTDFLQALTLVASQERRRLAISGGTVAEKAPGVTCKRKDILKLTLEEYKTWANAVTSGFQETAKFLHGQKIFTARDIPYKTQLVPLTAIFTLLGDKAQNHGIRLKLAQWYWCGVFGELYGSAIESRFAKDLPEVLAWAEGGSKPDTVATANFTSGRLLGLRTRNSAAYKGIYALLLQDGGPDFCSGIPIDEQVYFDDKVDIHHIFPKDWCKKQGLDVKRYDSAVNKTPISARTNRKISSKSPGTYLPILQKSADISDDQMESILYDHLIDPDTLRQDDFERFFRTRESALLDRISGVMGKSISREGISSIDYSLFSSDWHPFLKSLSELDGLAIASGSNIDEDTDGSYFAVVARGERIIHLVDGNMPSAVATKSVLEQSSSTVLLVTHQEPEVGLASVIFALQETTEQDSVVPITDDTELPNEKREPKVDFRQLCVNRLSSELGLTLLPETRTGYVSVDNSVAVICTISKNYQVSGHDSYWFAFHPSQKEFLQRYPKSYVALGCGAPEHIVLLPFQELVSWLDDFWTTEKEDRSYWHIRVHKKNGLLELDRKKGLGRLDVTSYSLSSNYR